MATPTIGRVGDEVTVGVRNSSPMDRNIFPNNPRVLEFTGTILRSELWDPKDAFRITGDDFMPIRVISMSLVTSINGKEVAQPENAAPTAVQKERTFTVDGSKGQKYTVTVSPDGKAACTCTGFGFRGYCKHSTGVQEQLKQGEIA